MRRFSPLLVMNALPFFRHRCRCVFRPCRLFSMLVLSCLTASCGGSGGSSGGSNSSAGKGELTQPSGEAGKAPACLIPAGYGRAQLSVLAGNVELGIDCRSTAPGAFSGTAEASAHVPGNPVSGITWQQAEGIWQQQAFSEGDRLRDIMVECLAGSKGALGVYGLELHIDTRADEAEQMRLIGSVTAGELVLASHQGNSARYGLAGGSFTLILSR